jgi:hypothetical protein
MAPQKAENKDTRKATSRRTLLVDCGQSAPEHTALSGFGLNGYCAAMSFHYPFCNRQTGPGSLHVSVDFEGAAYILPKTAHYRILLQIRHYK